MTDEAGHGLAAAGAVLAAFMGGLARRRGTNGGTLTPKIFGQQS